MMKVAAIIVVVVAMSMVLTMLPMGASGLSCGDVDIDLLPCLGYIRSGGEVPSGCCGGLGKLVTDAKTTDDRRAACNCLKDLAKRASNDELARAAALPGLCHISLPYPFDPSTDCSKIN